jgi:hypothetical protein
MSEDTREEVAYIYTRNGVQYFTPVERLASARTDTGTYSVVYAEDLCDDENKLEEVK